jgi:ABC-type Na+ transport system ATPase subunit NatA
VCPDAHLATDGVASSADAASPLLEVEAARIDLEGTPLIDGLTFGSSGTRLGLVGAAQGLFELLAGRATLSAGRVLIEGIDGREAVLRGHVGLCRSRPEAPARLTSLDVLTHSASLLGMSFGDARRRARQKLHELGLDGLGGRVFQALTLGERRLVWLTHALLSDPTTLCVELPFAELDAQASSVVREAIDRASRERRLIVWLDSAVEASSGSQFALDDVLVLERNAPTARRQASMASAHRYTVVVGANTTTLLELLDAAGCQIEVASPTTLGDAPLLGATKLVVTLPYDAESTVILEASVKAEAPVLELVPWPEPA